MIVNGKKRCPGCKIEKTPDEYTKSPWQADGLYSYCLVCTRKRTKAFQTSEKGKEYIRNFSKANYQKHKLKHRARAKVRRAIEKGDIEKPNVCENCGIESKLDAHHNDYSKPLEVLWLCILCHKKTHNRLKDSELLSKTESAARRG